MDVDAGDGRIYLPKAVRETYGEQFDLADRGDRLVFIPIAEDPLEALREEVRPSEKSVRD